MLNPRCVKKETMWAMIPDLSGHENKRQAVRSKGILSLRVRLLVAKAWTEKRAVRKFIVTIRGRLETTRPLLPDT